MSFINVLFKRVTTAIRGTEAIEDGKILLDYERPSIYVDNGSTRVELTPRDTALSTTSTNAIANNALTNSIINTTAEVSAITADNIPCGTKPVKELINRLNDIDDKTIINGLLSGEVEISSGNYDFITFPEAGKYLVQFSFAQGPAGNPLLIYNELDVIAFDVSTGSNMFILNVPTNHLTYKLRGNSWTGTLSRTLIQAIKL